MIDGLSTSAAATGSLTRSAIDTRIVAGGVGRVQAAQPLQGFQPVFAHPSPRQHNGFAGNSAYHWQSTLTAKQAEIQFKRKFVKKITNSTNRGRNELFVRI